MRRREFLGLVLLTAAAAWPCPPPLTCELRSWEPLNWPEVAEVAKARLRCLGSIAPVATLPHGIRIGFPSQEERMRLLPALMGRSPYQLMIGYYDPRAQRQIYAPVEPLGQELTAFPNPDPEYRTPAPQPHGPAYVFQEAHAVGENLEIDLAIRNTKSAVPFHNIQFQLEGKMCPVSLQSRPGAQAPSGYWPGRLTVKNVPAERWAALVRCGTYPQSLYEAGDCGPTGFEP